jgi:hypothetical protein
MVAYESVMTPITIGNVEIPNRVVTRINRLMPLLESARMETTVKKRLGNERFEFIGDSKVVEVRSGHVVVQSIYGQRTRCVEADLVSFVGPTFPSAIWRTA